MDKVFGYLQKLLPIFGFYPEWAQWLFMACLALVLLSVFVGLVTYSTAARTQTGYVVDGGLPALTVAARKYNCKYVIESATMIVKLDASGSEVGKKKVVDVRIIYTIFAIDDTSVFDEGYHTLTSNATVKRILGSEVEPRLDIKSSPTEPNWDIKVSLKRGERYTLTTGAEYAYVAPFPVADKVYDFDGLSENQGAWCYPNTEDVIGQLTILIESSTPIVQPVSGDMITADRRADAEKPIIAQDKPVLHVPDKYDAPLYVIVGTWKNIMPNQYCEMRITR